MEKFDFRSGKKSGKKSGSSRIDSPGMHQAINGAGKE